MKFPERARREIENIKFTRGSVRLLRELFRITASYKFIARVLRPPLRAFIKGNGLLP